MKDKDLKLEKLGFIHLDSAYEMSFETSTFKLQGMYIRDEHTFDFYNIENMIDEKYIGEITFARISELRKFIKLLRKIDDWRGIVITDCETGEIIKN